MSEEDVCVGLNCEREIGFKFGDLGRVVDLICFVRILLFSFLLDDG